MQTSQQRSWSLFIASLAILGVSFYWPKFFSSLQKSTSLATVISKKGTTEWTSRQSFTRKPVDRSLRIHMNDTLATGSDGELTLRFRRGAEVRLLPSSSVTLIRKANSTLLALRRGQIDVLTEGEGQSILVSQGGLEKPLRDYQGKLETQELWIDPQSLDTIKTVDVPPPSLPTSLEGGAENAESSLTSKVPLLSPITEKQSQDLQTQVRQMITDRINSQKNHLFRCYSNLIQKKKNEQGKIDIHFTVNNSGRVEAPSVLKSEIKDRSFEQCLLGVIKRVEFRPFHGEKVSTLLPLRFEKGIITQ